MGTRDPRIDSYIAKSADFAKPILEYLRETVHAGCPDVQETIKWGMPFFDYNGVLCHMAAFKEHCGFGFWKQRIVADSEKADEAMGQMGRITSLADLPPKKELLGLIKEAARRNDEKTKMPPPKVVRAPKPPLETPEILRAALAKNKKARETFEAFAPSHRRDYVEWITEAKSDATKDKRVAQAIEWMAEGKSRNWKYERK